MRLSEPRLAPLAREDWPAETREVMQRFQRPESPGTGDALNIFKTLAHHPDLLKRWTVFGNHVLYKSTLSAREREIAILRVGWLCRAEYEWAQHVVIGRKAGLSDEDIENIAAGPEAPGLDPFEAVLLRAVDELHADSMIGEDTWKALAERYEAQQLIDLVFAVGQYHLVSMALNTLGVQLDPGLEGFPDTADAGD